jgi:hypothetical protein
MKTDIEGTNKKIQTFFEDHPTTFVSKLIPHPSDYINANDQNPQTQRLYFIADLIHGNFDKLKQITYQ